MANASIKRQTALSGNIVLFCRHLRSKGFAIGTQEEADALKALSCLPLEDPVYFRAGLRAVLARNKRQQLEFDDLYDDFWKQLARAVDSKIRTEENQEKKARQPSQPKAPSFQALKAWLYQKPAEEETEMAAYSAIETLGRKDFSEMTEAEIRLMMTLLRRIARRLAHQKSRLKKVSKKRRKVDLKRTIRANMRRGGGLQQLVFSEPKDKKMKLVLLCDVSKSMDLYSRFFIHLIYAFQHSYDKIETFVFSTALHRISEILEQYDFDAAFEIVAERVPQWSGGTKIGACLADFVSREGRRMLNKKTVVLILSDGWDTGEPEVLRESMRVIHKVSRKVIWLNPLAGNPGFTPEVTGMKTALPYVDVFASAHNLESLRDAMQHLKGNRK